MLPTPTPTPRPHHPDKTLLSAWLLLLLFDGEMHGWALRSALAGRGIDIDGARIYRDLRALEDAGALTSRWTESVGGPKRRCYRLGPEGRATLDELVGGVTATWKLHAAFVEAHEHAQLPSEHADGEDAESEAPPRGVADAQTPDAHTPRMGRELVAAWLLLLLERGASYGYDLRRALDDHDVHPDAGTLYRVLRQLDDAGWLQSRWMASVSGPKRRLYRVTSRGRRNLDELTVVIMAIRDGHGTFLAAHKQVLGGGGAQRNGR